MSDRLAGSEGVAGNADQGVQVNLNISFRNTEPTEAIKGYAREKLIAVMQKFLHRDSAAELVLSVENKDRHIAELVMQADGHDIKVGEESASMYASIDALADALTKQLRKNKEKMTRHH